MKKLILVLALFLLSHISTNQAFAQSTWKISSFDSAVQLEKTGQITVTETIFADFGNISKHGIYRDLPYVYQSDKEKIYTTINILAIERNDENEKYESIKNSSNLRLKIGNANITISGIQKYTVVYSVEGVLRNFGDYDELYWNTTGNDWEVPIEKASSSITIPFEGIQKTACFEGSLGSQTPCVTQSNTLQTANFTSYNLSPGQGQSVVLGYRPGIIPILVIAPPKTTWERITNPYSLFSFVIVFILGNFFVVRKWWTSGRDKFFRVRYVFDKNAKETTKPLFHKDTIVVEYTPPEKLRPAELGVLQDEKADTKDITATIIDLASRGFMDIEEIPKKWLFGTSDYKLIRKKTGSSELLNYEGLLFDKLFSHGTDGVVKISELKQKFYTDLAKVKTQLYEDVVAKKFFPTNPEKVRTKYFGIAFFVLVASISLCVLSINKIPELLDIFLASTSAGILLLVISKFMSRRTARGQEIYRRIQGYQLFISQVEKHKQQFLENKNIITEILPYTIIFGLTEKFAKALKDIGIDAPTPTWYHSTHPFIFSDFSKSMNTFSSSMSSSISSAPRSSGFSGGGSSGGGFGGGGGGSW